jgi:hypothetical protein
MRSLIDRFRNAPPMPKEERDKMRKSDASEDLWWKKPAEAQRMDETVISVKNELNSLESTFNSYGANVGFGAAGSASKWASVGGGFSQSTATAGGPNKLSP